LVGIALIACVVCYLAGFRTGAQQSLAKNDRQGQIALLLHAYRAAEATNWARVHSALEMQLLGATRTYEREFGRETGTSRFAQVFTEARIIVDRTESKLAPLSSVLTNLPLAPNAKISVREGK